MCGAEKQVSPRDAACSRRLGTPRVQRYADVHGHKRPQPEAKCKPAADPDTVVHRNLILAFPDFSNDSVEEEEEELSVDSDLGLPRPGEATPRRGEAPARWALMTRSLVGLVSKLLFPAPKASYREDTFRRPGESIAWLPVGAPGTPRWSTWAERGRGVPCLFIEDPCPRALFVVFHSNADDLGKIAPFCRFLRTLWSAHVVAMEYPGYGVNDSTLSKERLLQDAEAVLRHVLDVMAFPRDRVILLGRSIGSGPCLALASKHRVAGSVLVTPFRSVRQLVADRASWAVASLVDEWFDNEQAIRDVRDPVLIVHGRHDRLVPHSHSFKLAKLCPAPVTLISPEDMEHNDCLATDAERFIEPASLFINSTLGIPQEGLPRCCRLYI